MPTAALIGTLDTKGEECGFLKSLLVRKGCSVIVIDVGVLNAPAIISEITREEIAEAPGTSVNALTVGGDRGLAIEKMGAGAANVLRRLLDANRIDGVIAIGGSGGSSIAAAAMRALPLGVPKLLVSTIAAGDVSSYVGETDLTMMYSVVDIAGLNILSKRILANAAFAIAGMISEPAKSELSLPAHPLVAITMFGVTTPGVMAARDCLKELGYEVLVFHANGAGGRAMERLVKDGYVAGVLDLTTTELADELLGGRLSAGPRRLEVAGELGVPQVVSLGALDMVNFRPIEDVPERYKHRRLYKHNPNVTLMRVTAEESEQLGKLIGHKLSKARGPVCVFIPLRGVSAISQENEVFYDAEADAALARALTRGLGPSIEVVSADMHINDPSFACAAAMKLHHLIANQGIGVHG